LGRALYSWLLFPPVATLPLFLLLLVGGGEGGPGASGPVWIVALFGYAVSTGFSGFLLANDRTEGLLPLDGFAQGILFLPLSQTFSALPVLPWVAAALLSVSLVGLAYRGAVGASATSGAPEQSPRLLAAAIREAAVEFSPLPAAYADAQGLLVQANAPFRKALDLPSEGALSLPLAETFPEGESRAVLSEGEYRIHRKPDSEGVFLCLSPLLRETTPQPPASSAGPGLAILNPDTGLYTEAYLATRGPEEVERAQRYRRWLSGLLLSMELKPRADFPVPAEEERTLRASFGRRIRESVRRVDLPFLQGSDRYLILLPETSQSDAKNLMNRLKNLPREVFDAELLPLVNPLVRCGLTFYNGNTPMDFPTFQKSLETSLDSMEAE
jgi:hypothetical protein